MNISKEKKGDILILTIEEKEANLSKSDHFKELVLSEIAEGETKLIISFEKVEYLDSSFLGALVAILKNLLPLNGTLRITGLNSDIKNLFELTRLDKIFVLKDNLETALQDFA